MIFWKSWNWPSYSRECLLYWLCWHQVVETHSLTDTQRKTASWYFWLWMWRHVGTVTWRCSSTPTDYGNSYASGFKFPNTVITGHSSQYKMNGPFWSMSWKNWGHSNIRHCGCWRGVQWHYITFSQCTMTCSIIWIAWWELWYDEDSKEGRLVLCREVSSTEAVQILRWIDSNNRYTSHFCTFSILFGSFDRLESGPWKRIWILRTRHPILPNCQKPL